MPFNGLIGGRVGYWLLHRAIASSQENIAHNADPDFQQSQCNLDRTFGGGFQSYLPGKMILDYGCGSGHSVVTMARMGARLCIGLDVRETVLSCGRRLAAQMKLHERCLFLNGTDPQSLVPFYSKVDVVVSLDAFEHYPNPEPELQEMWKLLRSGGSLFISFGPPWWHPNGCHMMFMGAPPWTHVIFKENTVMAVRSLYRSDGAQRYEEVEGGLNRMTVQRFEHLVNQSQFQLQTLTLLPIRRTAHLARGRLGRELFTSVVRAHLVKP